MCITNIYVDQFPDGKQVEFRQTSYCQYGQPFAGRPCQKLSTRENPVRKIQFGEPTTEYMLTPQKERVLTSTASRAKSQPSRHSVQDTRLEDFENLLQEKDAALELAKREASLLREDCRRLAEISRAQEKHLEEKEETLEKMRRREEVARRQVVQLDAELRQERNKSTDLLKASTILEVDLAKIKLASEEWARKEQHYQLVIENFQTEKEKQSQTTSSPSTLSVQNRKQRDQASNRVSDIEFATEISTTLLSQVRKLQALLAEKEETLKNIQMEKEEQIRNHTIESDGLRKKLRALEEYIQDQKGSDTTTIAAVEELAATRKLLEEFEERELERQRKDLERARETEKMKPSDEEIKTELEKSSASDGASLGTAPGSPFPSQQVGNQRQILGAVQEALDAANDKIRQLEVANAKLDSALSESNREYRLLKREKFELHNELDVSLDETEDLAKYIEKDIRSEPSPKHSEQSELQLRYEEKAAEVNALRRHLAEMDRPSALKKRIADKDRTIASLKDYLRQNGFRVADGGDIISVAETGTTAENRLEQDEQNARNHKEARRDSDETQMDLRTINGIIVAVTRGDLSQSLMIYPQEIDSDIGSLKRSINTMVDHLHAVSTRVSIVSREHGQEGRLGGRVEVPDANGAWKEMIGNVNHMAQILTMQVREIACSIQAVGHGDFLKIIQVEAQGEILQLNYTINSVISQLLAIVTEVIKLGREVAVHGVLGGRIEEGGLQGMWETMVENTNYMSLLLTNQTRRVFAVANNVCHGSTMRVPEHIEVNPAGEIRMMYSAVDNMLTDLENNWTRGTGEVEKAGHDQKLQQERLQRVWAILHSNI